MRVASLLPRVPQATDFLLHNVPAVSGKQYCTESRRFFHLFATRLWLLKPIADPKLISIGRESFDSESSESLHYVTSLIQVTSLHASRRVHIRIRTSSSVSSRDLCEYVINWA